ncbi:MAG: DUF1993 domain-containing protein [Sphingobium sp.]|nr:DUF1993 domain-containing protein [Sphingobium sp.]
MAISLYDALVPSWIQIVTAVRGLLDKAETYCAEQGIAEGDIITARLADDMMPFNMQIHWIAHHSMGAFKGVKAGLFQPTDTPPAQDFAGLKAELDAALEGLAQITPDHMEYFEGSTVRFVVPAYNLDIAFTAENFLLSFSQPNFYFHATTAYDILRGKGMAIGKVDFLGPLRIKAQ